MAGIRILFADDQIPDEGIADDQINTRLKEQHPDWRDGFINAFRIMRKAVATLRDAGYQVDVARTHRDSISMVRTKTYDLAIIDLGWYADETLPKDERPYAGWEISQAMEEADRKRKKRPTLQIIYSNRFERDPTISIQAAGQGKLPLFKIYNDAGHQALRAAVKFIEANLSSPSSAERFVESTRQLLLECLVEPLKQQRLWFYLTITFVSLSFALLIGGLATSIWVEPRVGVISSASSILTGAVSSLLYAQLRRSQRALERGQARLESLMTEYEKHVGDDGA